MKRDRKNCISRKGAKSVEERISFAGLASWRDKVFDHGQQQKMLEINSHTSESKNITFVTLATRSYCTDFETLIVVI
jgi:hypothetical protein